VADEAVIRIKLEGDGGGAGGTGGGGSSGGGSSSGGGGRSKVPGFSALAKDVQANREMLNPFGQIDQQMARLAASTLRMQRTVDLGKMGANVEQLRMLKQIGAIPDLGKAVADASKTGATLEQLRMLKQIGAIPDLNKAPPPGMFAGALKMADRFRGTLGGMMGPGVGAGIDIASMVAGAGAMGPLAMVGVAAAGAAIGLKAFDRGIQPLIDRFSHYSAAIAGAEAQADVRRQLNDMRRAEQAGPRFAEYINARSNLSETWEDIKTVLTDSLAPIATTMLGLLQLLLEALKVGLLPLQVVGEIWNGASEGFKNILRFVKIIAERDDAAEGFNFDPFHDILVPSGQGI
jgi:hypothetical protein